MPQKGGVVEAVYWGHQLDKLIGTQGKPMTGLHVDGPPRPAKAITLTERIFSIGHLEPPPHG
eukprot:6117074-Pyramimonas_sp.AAC.1